MLRYEYFTCNNFMFPGSNTNLISNPRIQNRSEESKVPPLGYDLPIPGRGTLPACPPLLCHDFATTLPQLCHNSARTLPRPCHDFATAFPGLFQDFSRTLPRPYHDFATPARLPDCCLNSAVCCLLSTVCCLQFEIMQ